LVDWSQIGGANLAYGAEVGNFDADVVRARPQIIALRGQGFDVGLRLRKLPFDRDEVCRSLRGLVVQHRGQAIAKDQLGLEPPFNILNRGDEIFGRLSAHGDLRRWCGQRDRKCIERFRFDANGRVRIDMSCAQPIDRGIEDRAAKLDALGHVPLLNDLDFVAENPEREAVRDGYPAIRGSGGVLGW
jgi:hypothetical protein